MPDRQPGKSKTNSIIPRPSLVVTGKSRGLESFLESPGLRLQNSKNNGGILLLC